MAEIIAAMGRGQAEGKGAKRAARASATLVM